MIMNQIQLEDCRNIGNFKFIEWEQFKDSTILITGSTGLIGQNLVNAIAYNSQEKALGIQLILPVRNTEAAEKQFGWTGAKIIHYELGEELEIANQVDFIVILPAQQVLNFLWKNP